MLAEVDQKTRGLGTSAPPTEWSWCARWRAVGPFAALLRGRARHHHRLARRAPRITAPFRRRIAGPIWTAALELAQSSCKAYRKKIAVVLLSDLADGSEDGHRSRVERVPLWIPLADLVSFRQWAARAPMPRDRAP